MKDNSQITILQIDEHWSDNLTSIGTRIIINQGLIDNNIELNAIGEKEAVAFCNELKALIVRYTINKVMEN